jgi:hypothetical protein
MPTGPIAWHCQIWNHLIQPAGDAKLVWIAGLDHPVADLMLQAIVAMIIQLTGSARS